MVGWRHRLNGHEFEQALGVGDGQGGLACCSPWGHKESDMTDLNNKSPTEGSLLGASPSPPIKNKNGILRTAVQDTQIQVKPKDAFGEKKEPGACKDTIHKVVTVAQ